MLVIVKMIVNACFCARVRVLLISSVGFEPKVAVDHPYNQDPRLTTRLRQREESEDMRLDRTGSDGGSCPGVGEYLGAAHGEFRYWKGGREGPLS